MIQYQFTTKYWFTTWFPFCSVILVYNVIGLSVYGKIWFMTQYQYKQKKLQCNISLQSNIGFEYNINLQHGIGLRSNINFLFNMSLQQNLSL